MKCDITVKARGFCFCQHPQVAQFIGCSTPAVLIGESTEVVHIDIFRSSGSSGSAGISFNNKFFDFSSGVGWSHSSTFKTAFKEMKNHRSLLFKVNTQVSLSEFIYKKENFHFSKYWLESVKALPATSSLDKAYPAYSAFFKQYGTHYVHSGTLGGDYTYTYVFSEDSLSKMNQNSKTTTKCLRISAGFHLFGIGLGGKHTKCTTISKAEVSANGVANAAQKKIIDVSGGTAMTAGKADVMAACLSCSLCP